MAEISNVENTSNGLNVAGFKFSYVCDIEPIKDSEGHIAEFRPQGRYKNAASSRLNKYGEGPFCKFKIQYKLGRSGMYLIIVNGCPKYVGECVDLAQRFNTGYGNISPRNCYIGGQETNCRINSLLLGAIKIGDRVSLWFLETSAFKEVELQMRSLNRFDWNRI